MVPLYVLTGSFVAFMLLGHAGIFYFHDWQHALRASLGIMFLLTASAHWGRRRTDLIAMVPPMFPKPALLVTLTGMAEGAGGVALQFPKLAFLAATGLFLMLIAVFPANIFAAKHRLAMDGRTVPSLLPRLVIQIIFLAALALAVVPFWPSTH
jgi:uncharacterized membrane protein